MALAIFPARGDTLFSLISPAPGSTVSRTDGPYTVGSVITVKAQNLVVTHLGALDPRGTGFASPVSVGLWSRDGGILIAQINVLTSDPLTNGYRYHALGSPVTLNAGTSYLIGARVGAGITPYPDSWPANLIKAAPSILTGNAGYAGGTSLIAPTNTGDYATRWASANAAFTLGGNPVANGYATTVYPRTTQGTWDGWGTSLCWWANVFGTRDDLADLVFTTNYTSLNGFPLPGLGLNIARYNAGASGTNHYQGAAMTASPNLSPFRQISGFWLDWANADPNSASWNFSLDNNQRTMLLKARARGANLFELFSNSPLWWMCYNHNPSGSDSGTSDNLQSWNYDQHAIYLASIAQYASRHWGINFNSVEAFNEPSSGWWNSSGTQEGCHFDVPTQSAVISYLRSELDNRALQSVSVAASDENTYDQATATWNSLGATAQAKVGRVNVHGYQYGGGRRDLLYSATVGRKLWNSEYGESDGSGMSLASNLNLDFRWLHPTGWCYWQPLDSGGWGLIQSNPGDNWIGGANPKYFVLAQYTRHLRPGMTMIDSGDGNTVAAYNPTERKLVLVTANYGTPQWVTYSLTNFASVAGPIRSWVTATATGPVYQYSPDLSVQQKTFKAWFPSNTIQTFEIQNLDLDPPPSLTGKLKTGTGQLTLSWPAPAVGYQLYQSTNLAKPAWSQVSSGIQTNGATINWTVPAGAGSAFYQLR